MYCRWLYVVGRYNPGQVLGHLLCFRPNDLVHIIQSRRPSPPMFKICKLSLTHISGYNIDQRDLGAGGGLKR